MNKFFSQGLLAAVVISLVACGGGNGGGNKLPPNGNVTPSSTSSSSIVNSSVSSSTVSSSTQDSSSSQGISSSDNNSSNMDSSATTSSASSSVATLTGVFLDNVVAGIGYRTETLQGVTSALGEYNYLPGETVIFFIGELDFPAVPANGVVTPADIANAAHSNSSDAAVTKINILQLLQTLDKDGDPVNGIQITEATRALFAGPNLPDVTATQFDAQIVNFLPPNIVLVDETAALAHFESTLQSQLLGSWIYSEGPGKRNVLTFIDATRYIIIHEHDDQETQRPGSVEYGTYAWDIDANELAVTMVGQSDENGGLWEAESAENGVVIHTLSLNGAQLILGTPQDGEAIFTRIIDSTNPVIGGWAMTELEDNNLNVLTFLSSTEYVIAHTNNQESYTNAPNQANQPLSGEFGTYTLTNKVFKVTGASVDTDGEGGLFNREDLSDQYNETIEVMPWGDLLFKDDNEGTFSFMRIGNFAAHLQDMAGSNSLGIISAIRDASGFNPDELPQQIWSATVPLANGGHSTFEFTFDALDSEGNGSATLLVEETGELSEYFTPSWKMNSTGAIVLTVIDDHETLTLTLAKLVGNTTSYSHRAIFSIHSEQENSLWETNFVALPQ